MTALSPAAGRSLWVAWRQQRAVLIGFGLMAAAAAVTLIVKGFAVRSAFAGLASHHCGTSPAQQICSTLVNRTGSATSAFGPVALNALPVIIGMFAGAPLFAREIEAGTLTFAFTQGTSRARWAASRLAVMAAAAAAIGCGLGLVGQWWLRAFPGTWWTNELTAVTPVTLAGWAALAVLLGAFLGALIARTIPAVAATTAVAVGAALGGRVLRDALRHIDPHVMRASPGVQVTCSTQCGVSVGTGQSYPIYQVSNWFTDASGHRFSVQVVDKMLAHLPASTAMSDRVLGWLHAHHLTYWLAYQPPGRYWLFQWAEFGALLAASALVFALAVVLMRRRSA